MQADMFLEPSILLTFLGASVLLTLAPGPDILFVLTQGMHGGRRSGVLTALGLCSGIIVHTLACALGISALFAASAFAFNLLKIAGAGYLLYLAFKTLMDRGGLDTDTPTPVISGPALFRRGILMNILNPKVALFFLAFLPQFADPTRGSVALQLVMLGLLFMCQAALVFSLVGIFAGTLGEKLTANRRLARGMQLGAAGVFALLGIRLAFVQH